MLNRASLGFGLWLMFVNACAGENPQQRSEPKIIGGDEVTNSNSYLARGTVALGFSKVDSETGRPLNFLSFCSGAVVSKSRIATAAHCLDRNYEHAQKLGYYLFISSGLSSAWDPARVLIKVTHVIHPQYSPEQALKLEPELPANDVAYLNIDDGQDVSQLKVIPFLEAEEDLSQKTQFLVAGFGVGNSQRNQRDRLKKLSAYFMKYFSQASLFTLDSKLGASCDGDSGGPVFIEKNEELYLTGLASTSNCYDDMRFTDIRLYKTFLLEEKSL